MWPLRRHGLCSASTLAGVGMRTDAHSSLPLCLPGAAAMHAVGREQL